MSTGFGVVRFKFFFVSDFHDEPTRQYTRAKLRGTRPPTANIGGTARDEHDAKEVLRPSNERAPLQQGRPVQHALARGQRQPVRA